MFNHPLVAWGALIVLCGAVFWGGKIQEHKSRVTTFMTEIRSDVKRILGRLPAQTTASASPIRLTDLGETVSVELSAKDWAEPRVDRVLENHGSKSAYEIQEYCFQYVKQNNVLDDEMREKVLASAFEHGLTRDQVVKVLGIELRDIVLRRLQRMHELP